MQTQTEEINCFWVGLDGLLNARYHSQGETDAVRYETVRIEILKCSKLVMSSAQEVSTSLAGKEDSRCFT